MPYSFTQIEQDKSRTIGFVFAFLIAFYFLVILIISLGIKNYFHLKSLTEFNSANDVTTFVSLNAVEMLMILLVASAVGWGHWLCSVGALVPRMLRAVRAQPLDERDSYHQMLKNIIAEVQVATGGKNMEGMVIPTAAMNAFALSDFEGKSIIGVTEGLLSRLTRSQIEAVVGHEAAHIVSGDCLETTVTSSLFALYNSSLSGISKLFRGNNRWGGSSFLLLFFIYIVLSITKLMSQLASMFISRQREFKADAIAVRLTRDPLSLAEALYDIAYHWRGTGLSGEEIEAIFIVNPNFSELDEQSGLLADLFSTHPPVEQRLKILMDMAHVDVKALEESYQKSKNKPRQTIPETQENILPQDSLPSKENFNSSANEWLVYERGQWLGPFNFLQIQNLEGLTPETWVKKKNGQISPAYEDPEIHKMLQDHCVEKNNLSRNIQVQCPRCHLPFIEIYYEGFPILKCYHCQGVLVHEKEVQRIIIREIVGFPERVLRVSRLIAASPRRLEQNNKLKLASLYFCPRCSDPKPKMIRMFYTLAYPVEIDKCLLCGFIWFDRDELEILQCLIEECIHKDQK